MGSQGVSPPKLECTDIFRTAIQWMNSSESSTVRVRGILTFAALAHSRPGAICGNPVWALHLGRVALWVHTTGSTLR